MKKITFLIVAILFAWATTAQTTFTVPERTAEQQYTRVAQLFNYNLIVSINYAKSMGKTVEDYGRYCGDIYKLTWPKGGDFNFFVEGNILNLTDLSERVEIVSQSENKVVLKVYNLYRFLREKGSDYDVTYEEYIQFLQSSHNQIAGYMDCTIKFRIVDDGVEVIMEKKQHQVTMGLFTPDFYQPQKVKGWIKQINYQTFAGKNENGKIVKGDPLKMSENSNHFERYKTSYLFNKNGELIRTLITTDNNWTRLLDYKDGRIDKTFLLKNDIPITKGELIYKGNKHTGSKWYNLETNDLTEVAKIEFDANNLWINKKTYNPKGELTGQGPKFIRDKDGVAKEWLILKKDGSVEYNNIFTYDEHGLPINIHRTISKGKTVNEDFKRVYEFDENGNWIKQIQFGPPADEIYIIERTFEFYKKRD